MNIDYVREFITFSEYLNYTTAAKHLYISQPSLSNHIATLEKELGVNLVSHGNTVKLTEAGRSLISSAPELLEMHDRVIDNCKRAALSGGSITFVRDTNTRSCNDENAELLFMKFMKKFPYIYLNDTDGYDKDVDSLLNKQGIDCACIYHTMLSTDLDKGIRYVKAPNYNKGHLCLWVHEKSPFAKRGHVTWDDLQELKIPFSRGAMSLWKSAIEELCNQHGVLMQSRIIPEEGWAFFAGFRDEEVYILDSGFEGNKPLMSIESRLLIPFEGEGSQSDLFIAYLETNENPALRVFIDYVAECAKDLSAEG